MKSKLNLDDQIYIPAADPLRMQAFNAINRNDDLIRALKKVKKEINLHIKYSQQKNHIGWLETAIETIDKAINK